MGYSRFARRYSGNRCFFLFLQVLRCFSSLGVPRMRYVFTQTYCSIKNSGFPHSEISGSKLTYSSPKHIGVSTVLHRLLVPRHSPRALINLTVSVFKPLSVSNSSNQLSISLNLLKMNYLNVCCFQCRFIQFSKNKVCFTTSNRRSKF